MSKFRNAPASAVLVAAAALLAAVTLVSGFTRYEVVNADRFAERAVDAASGSPARQQLATDLANDLIVRSEGELIAFRPLIEGSIEGVIGSPPFRGLLRSSVADLHRTVIQGRTDTTTILLSDIGVLASAALEKSNPALARQIPEGLDIGFDRSAIPQGMLDRIDDATWLADRFWLFAVASSTAPLPRRSGRALPAPRNDPGDARLCGSGTCGGRACFDCPGDKLPAPCLKGSPLIWSNRSPMTSSVP